MKEQKNNAKSIKGITLIALVITIVVLLILAAVSITAVFGDNGLLQMAKESALETRGATVEEQRDNWEVSKTLSEQTGNGTVKTLSQLLDELEANKLITKEERTEIEQNGEVTIGNRTIEFKDDEVTDPISIEEVKAGDWIIYPSAKGDITCRVLYDTAYNTENETDYGIQIVSENSVEDVILGHGDLNADSEEYNDCSYDEYEGHYDNCYWAENSYNSLLSTLNNKSKELVNEYFTDRDLARTIGYFAENEEEIEVVDGSYDMLYEETFARRLFSENIDSSNSAPDWEQLNNIGSVGSDFWLCCKVHVSGSFGDTSNVYGVWVGGKNPRFEQLYNGGDHHAGFKRINGLRPVFTLKSGLSVTGKGTKNNPYKLVKE